MTPNGHPSSSQIQQQTSSLSPGQPAKVSFPLLIDFVSTFFGNGFVAEVRARGRLLGFQESDKSWALFGVSPSGVCAFGAELEEAHAECRAVLVRALLNVAKTANTFAEFKSAVQAYFNATNLDIEDLWQSAVRKVRAENTTVPGLIKKPAESDFSVHVILKEASACRPEDNSAVLEASLATAA